MFFAKRSWPKKKKKKSKKKCVFEMIVIVIIKSEMRPRSVYENDTVECVIIALAYDILPPTIAIIDVMPQVS